MEEELLKAEATTKRGGVKNNASKYVVVSAVDPYSTWSSDQKLLK